MLQLEDIFPDEQNRNERASWQLDVKRCIEKRLEYLLDPANIDRAKRKEMEAHLEPMLRALGYTKSMAGGIASLDYGGGYVAPLRQLQVQFLFHRTFELLVEMEATRKFVAEHKSFRDLMGYGWNGEWKYFWAAPIVCPEMVNRVLEAHGLPAFPEIEAVEEALKCWYAAQYHCISS